MVRYSCTMVTLHRLYWRLFCRLLGHDWESYFVVHDGPRFYSKRFSPEARCKRCRAKHG